MARNLRTTRLRRVFAVLLVVALMGALGASAFAYDATTGSDLPTGTPTSNDRNIVGANGLLERSDEWSIRQVWHWVTRGETLASIAARYGTYVTEIVNDDLNENYFRDLNLRNDTTGLNVQLEPGVKLHIYDLVTVRHFVRRGDTWARLTSGLSNGNFTLITNQDAIIRENPDYFANLKLIRDTEQVNYTLLESDRIFGRYVDFTGTYVDDGRDISLLDPFGGVTDVREVRMDNTEPGLVSPTAAGLPLYITVPVRVRRVSAIPDQQYLYENLTYLAPGGLEKNRDRWGWSAVVLDDGTTREPYDLWDYQQPRTNPIPSNDLLGTSIGWKVPDGWTRTLFLTQDENDADGRKLSPAIVHWTLYDPGFVPGIYGSSAKGGSSGSGSGAQAASSRYTQNGGRPSDPQPAGATAYWNGLVGNGAQILQNIANSNRTAVAAIRAKNPGYFAYLDQHHVSLEANVWIWI